jgi:hypothetical protein
MLYLTLGGYLLTIVITWFFSKYHYTKGNKEILKQNKYNLELNQIIMKELNNLTGKNAEIIYDKEGMPKRVQHATIHVPPARVTTEAIPPTVNVKNKNKENL